MVVDAVILAGGRSRRLGGHPKSDLVVDGTSLLHRAVTAARDARSIVVVSDPRSDLPGEVRTIRETPAFGGPVAGLHAGLGVLLEQHPHPDWVLALACDMPRVDEVVPLLLAAARADGAIAVDSAGQDQYLAGVYRTEALVAELAGDVQDRSMRSVVGRLDLIRVATQTATDDIDTPADAERFGAIHERAPR